MLNKFLDFLLCIFYLLPIRLSEISVDNENICGMQQTCSQCLQIANCIWCSEVRDDEHNGLLIRCKSKALLKKKNDWCSSEYLIASESHIEILENKMLHSGKQKDTVQVQPQKMRVSLRLGEEQIVKFNYSKAMDYPVDLYYLMDLSFSMEPYREQLSKLGDNLAEAMTQLTSNFRLGFGSFVDKVALPMTSIQPKKLNSPCTRPTGETCAPPYGFKNQMPLTENLSLFKSNVKEAPVSGNLDGLEGGFDAMMQAIVCTEKIGWRQKARHLLVFSTDADFHIAGDGRLAGIILPNDELCHLDKNGFYSYSLLQDYPSISQINRKAEEYNINIIFAVPKSMHTTYQILSKSISGSSIGLLENDSKNVVSLVSKEYEKLVDSITVVDDAPKFIDIRYFSKCLNENSILKEGRECNGLRMGNVVEFQVFFKAVSCPNNSSEWNHTIKIGPRGLNESLELNVELICNCPCEEQSSQKHNQKFPVCKGHGNQICGVCKCDKGFYGKQCECKGSDLEFNLFDGCIANNESRICSGRGTCKCGVCECEKRFNTQEEFYGNYCECDNFSCKRSNGLICGGQGKCECGSCKCLPGWIGEACTCKESNDTCISSKAENVICSGRGNCICGSCHCYETANIRYSGKLCEQSSTRHAQPCEELKHCVECLAYKSGPLAKDNQCIECLHKLNITKRVENWFGEEMKQNDARICRIPAEERCSFTFKYKIDKNTTENKDQYFEVIVQKQKDCPIPVNIMGVTLSVIIGTVILGFCILLLWKLIISIHDRREYARFEKEKVLVKWEKRANPFYKEATTTFKNPTFQGH